MLRIVEPADFFNSYKKSGTFLQSDIQIFIFEFFLFKIQCCIQKSTNL